MTDDIIQIRIFEDDRAPHAWGVAYLFASGREMRELVGTMNDAILHAARRRKPPALRVISNPLAPSITRTTPPDGGGKRIGSDPYRRPNDPIKLYL